MSARKSHSPIQEAAVCGVTREGAAAGAARGATPRVTVGATGEAVAVGVSVGVGLGVRVEVGVGVDLGVEMEGGLAVAVARGAVGAVVASGGEGTEGRGFTGGVGVAATRETSAVGVARRAMTTFGPQETEDSRRAAAQRVGSLRNVGVNGALLRRASYLAGISASDNRSLPAGTFSSFVVFPEGQRTVTRSAVSASPRPK